MRIHTVKEGDTIFKIARAYSTPPSKIIENNALSTPDRLYPGQKLLILTPTRSYTVRGGDTLDSIALRFMTDKRTLLKNNPGLMGHENIYPGQILAIKYSERPYGNTVVNGYHSKSTTFERFSLFLPHLTYITFAAGLWRDEKLYRLYDCSSALNTANLENVIPILRIYTESSAIELKTKKKEFLNSVSEACTSDGFSGISLAAYRALDDSELYFEFLRELKCELQNMGLELHGEFDASIKSEPLCEYSKICKLTVLNCERVPGDTENAACDDALFFYAEKSNQKNELVDLSATSYLGNESCNFSEIEELIRRRGIAPEYCEKTRRSKFKIKKYSAKGHEELSGSLPTPENIKAKLEFLAELGFMGVSVDIATTPVFALMMIHSFFNSERAAKNKNSCRSTD